MKDLTKPPHLSVSELQSPPCSSGDVPFDSGVGMPLHTSLDRVRHVGKQRNLEDNSVPGRGDL